MPERDPRYALLDAKLNAAYKRIMHTLTVPQRDRLREDERRWLKQRDETLPNLDAYFRMTEERIRVLEQPSGPLD